MVEELTGGKRFERFLLSTNALYYHTIFDSDSEQLLDIAGTPCSFYFIFIFYSFFTRRREIR
jgi:hypothetical protein